MAVAPGQPEDHCTKNKHSYQLWREGGREGGGRIFFMNPPDLGATESVDV